MNNRPSSKDLHQSQLFPSLSKSSIEQTPPTPPLSGRLKNKTLKEMDKVKTELAKSFKKKCKTKTAR